MSSVRLQGFRSFLTERLTAVAMEVFGEVESIVVECCEENKRLRDILHMVLNPEIKLHRIDVNNYAGEQPSEPNTGVDLEISEGLTTIAKAGKIEYDLSWDQRQVLTEADNFITPVCVKEEHIECDISLEQHLGLGEANNDFTSDCFENGSKEEEEEDITDTNQIHVAGTRLEASANSSTDEAAEDGDCTSDESEADCQIEEGTSESHTFKKGSETSNTKLVCPLQKTMLEFPRLTPMKFTSVVPSECQSFIERLKEAYRDFPDDQKPLITKMGLTTDVEWVDCASGKVPKGSLLSYQCPVPSSQGYTINSDAPSRLPLPLSHHELESVSAIPTLSAKEQEHVNAMQVTWEEAHTLEKSTRGCRENIKKLQKLRLTNRFREICKLKSGQSNIEHLIFKIQKGFSLSKAAQIEEEIKNEAFQQYCRQMCVNWYPCGFVVHPNAPWLGANPDGLVYDSNETNSFGLVHAKCVKFRSFIDCAFLICRNGVLQLNKNHPYYWHIQGEMMVTGTSWCDLLVLSREDMLVQRIYRDNVIIKIMKKKLDEFFFYYFLPANVKLSSTLSN
ncbi:uncharacterized protein LOC113022713 isoform X4 [Astatotilapia calliptera]|uniref:uncharacterized protein LOC113022713 isoform X4 n=1 Tax=Astatotilapia calliptera TaxID=8154 RepID=UPI000E414923|nr:uncharacterized protein LOC113022713 isoform X4 [Astatotilapia calliptera]